MRTSCLSLTLVILSSPALLAEDEEPDYGSGQVRHVEYFGGLRIDVGAAPGIKNIKTFESEASGVPDPAADGTTNLTAKEGFGCNASVFWDWSLDGGVGWALVPGFFYREVRGTAANAINSWSVTLRSGGFQIATGPSLTIGKINLELLPYVGIGSNGAKEDVTQVGFGGMQRDGGAGSIETYGCTVTADFVSNYNWLLGANVGYEGFHSSMNLRDSTSPTGLELAGQKAHFNGGGLLAQMTFAFWY
jgi:hypothetical protein